MRVVRAGFLSVFVVLVGCGSGDVACVENLPATCAPLYPADFHDLYTRTLHPTCAQSGARCHSDEGMMGGLVFENETTAYDLLLGKGGGNVNVLPNDPACSLIVEKLTSTDPLFQMPPGAPLEAAEQCVVITWIRDGAKP